MTSLNQKGFSLVEGLLFTLVIIAISFAGWYVWHAGQVDKQNDKTAAARSDTKASSSSSKADPTKNWKAYTSTTGKFSLRYPYSWYTASKPDLCSDDLLLLGSSQSLVGQCATDSGGQVMFAASDGDQRDNYEFKPAYYKNITHEDVTVDDVKGTVWSGMYSYAGEGIGPEVGTQETTYLFYTDGHTYVATYSQHPGSPDVSETFNLIVKNTLQFN